MTLDPENPAIQAAIANLPALEVRLQQLQQQEAALRAAIDALRALAGQAVPPAARAPDFVVGGRGTATVSGPSGPTGVVMNPPFVTKPPVTTLIAAAEQVLRRAGTPLHIMRLIHFIQADGTRPKDDPETIRVALVPSLKRKNDVFSREGPAIYGLVEWQDKK